MSNNETLFERAQRTIPGGVNSPVRAFRSVGGTPRFIERAQGPYCWDADGQRYIDYIGSWGPMILGHGHPAVLEAVQKAAAGGLSFGSPTEGEALLAEAIVSRTAADKVRMVNSGTEATLSAIRLARGAFQEFTSEDADTDRSTDCRQTHHHSGSHVQQIHIQVFHDSLQFVSV